MRTELEHLRQRLESISEELADLGMDRLRAAIDGDDRARREERRLQQARRAVERAVAALGDDEEWG